MEVTQGGRGGTPQRDTERMRKVVNPGRMGLGHELVSGDQPEMRAELGMCNSMEQISRSIDEIANIRHPNHPKVVEFSGVEFSIPEPPMKVCSSLKAAWNQILI